MRQLAYLAAEYRPSGASTSAFAEVQYLRQTGQGAQFLGTVDSTVYGAKLGFLFPEKTGDIYFVCNKVPTQVAGGLYLDNRIMIQYAL